MDFGITNKVALISGGTQGIGFAAAMALKTEGVRVVIFSRTQENVDTAIAQLGDGHNVFGFTCDLCDESSVDSMLEEVTTTIGPVDIFVGSSGGPSFGHARELTAQDMRQALDSNFVALAYLTNKLLPSMRSKQWGRIVFVTTSGVIQPVDNLALSNVSRSALTSFMKTLAGEVAQDGITVNTVIPGRIHTMRLTQVIEKSAETKQVSVDEIMQKDFAAIPARRYGLPEEMGNVIAFLCSDSASYVTGIKVPVDGGMINVM